MKLSKSTTKFLYIGFAVFVVILLALSYGSPDVTAPEAPKVDSISIDTTSLDTI